MDSASECSSDTGQRRHATAIVACEARCVLDTLRRTHALDELARQLPAVVRILDVQQQQQQQQQQAAASLTRARRDDAGVRVCALLVGAYCRRATRLLVQWQQQQQQQQPQQQLYASADASLAGSLLDLPAAATHVAVPHDRASSQSDALRAMWHALCTLRDRLVVAVDDHNSNDGSDDDVTTNDTPAAPRHARDAASAALAYSRGEVAECRWQLRAHVRQRLLDLTRTAHWDTDALVDVVVLLSELAQHGSRSSESCDKDKNNKTMTSAAATKTNNNDDDRGDLRVCFRRRQRHCYACALDARSHHRCQQQHQHDDKDTADDKGDDVTGDAALAPTRVLTPLRDALTRRVIATPARGRRCTHLDVVDVATFVYAAQQQRQRHGRRLPPPPPQQLSSSASSWSMLHAGTADTRSSGGSVVTTSAVPGANCPLCGRYVALDDVRIDDAVLAAMRAYNAATSPSSSSFAQPLSAQHMLEWDLLTQSVRVCEGSHSHNSNNNSDGHKSTRLSGSGGARASTHDDVDATTSPLLVDDDDDDDDNSSSHNALSRYAVAMSAPSSRTITTTTAAAADGNDVAPPVTRKRRVEIGGHVLYLDEV